MVYVFWFLVSVFWFRVTKQRYWKTRQWWILTPTCLICCTVLTGKSSSSTDTRRTKGGKRLRPRSLVRSHLTIKKNTAVDSKSLMHNKVGVLFACLRSRDSGQWLVQGLYQDKKAGQQVNKYKYQEGYWVLRRQAVSQNEAEHLLQHKRLSLPKKGFCRSLRESL